ncbi:MAG: MFS transporter, partial [Actinomycetota bacterium]|nr:MFS transporter [Actinomycetota bacterium]
MRLEFPVDLAAVPRIPRADGLLEEAEPRAPSAPEAVSGRAWRALVVASLGTVLVGFNSTATNIALDDIKAGFVGATAAEVGWGVAGYFIGTAAFLPLGGRLADRLGRKRMFQAGLVLFAMSAVLSAAAPTVWTLNLARVLQAIAGAAILPSSLSLVLPLFPASRRTTAVGMWSAAGPLAAAVAPVAAALILSAGGWRLVYFVSAPVAALMFLLAHVVLDELPPPPVRQRLDIVGAVAGTIAVASVVAAVMQGGTQWGLTSTTTITVGTVGLIAVVVFV